MGRALVIGASGGIGAALCEEFRARGEEVTGLSRRKDGLDVTDEASISFAFSKLSGAYDIVVIAIGALEIDGAVPEKTLRALTPEAMMDQFRLNAVGPALLLKHLVPLLPRNRRAVVGVLSARVGSIGDNRLGGWYSYRASKAAVNQLVHTVAIELARSHKQLICVALHPGTVATAFTQKYLGRHPAVTPSAAAHNLVNTINALTHDQTGGFFDYSGAEVPW